MGERPQAVQDEDKSLKVNFQILIGMCAKAWWGIKMIINKDRQYGGMS